MHRRLGLTAVGFALATALSVSPTASAAATSPHARASHTHLVRRIATWDLRVQSAGVAPGNDPTCTAEDSERSPYRGGVRLITDCTYGTEGFEAAGVIWNLRPPRAVSYGVLTLRSFGSTRSADRGSFLMCQWQNGDDSGAGWFPKRPETGLESAWRSCGSVAGAAAFSGGTASVIVEVPDYSHRPYFGASSVEEYDMARATATLVYTVRVPIR